MTTTKLNPEMKNDIILYISEEINFSLRANNLQFCHRWGREGERDYDGTKYPKMS